MAMRKLKDFDSVGEFNIIDNEYHNFIERLPRDEAIAKYGECDVWMSYTEADSQVPDAYGNVPSWRTDVWVEIPGMKIGYWNRSPHMHLYFCGDSSGVCGESLEASFIGKKTGQLITIQKFSPNDYSVCFRDPSEKDMENRGCSVRGTAAQIIELIKEEWEG